MHCHRNSERLNDRPRKILDFLTPNEVFRKLVVDDQTTPQTVALQT